jgi:hypothetical protein
MGDKPQGHLGLTKTFNAICIKPFTTLATGLEFRVQPLEIVEVREYDSSVYFSVYSSKRKLYWFSKKRYIRPDEYFYDYFRKL